MTGHTPWSEIKHKKDEPPLRRAWRRFKETRARRLAEKEVVRTREAREFWAKVMAEDPLALPKAQAKERGLELDTYKGQDARGTYWAFVYWTGEPDDYRTWTSDFVYVEDFMTADREVSLAALEAHIYKTFVESLDRADAELVPRKG